MINLKPLGVWFIYRSIGCSERLISLLFHQYRKLSNTHPEDRLVVVLSGTLHVGFGERFEPDRMRAMPAGSFFVEPARTPHFAWVRGEDAIVQVSGIGPSGTVYLDGGGTGH
jgi:hypothetical protein